MIAVLNVTRDDWPPESATPCDLIGLELSLFDEDESSAEPLMCMADELRELLITPCAGRSWEPLRLCPRRRCCDIPTMVEVPALLYQLDELLKRVDFVSVGSNDLFQFMFAVDRGNGKVSNRFDTLSAPILRALRDIVTKAKAAERSASLCGEMASQPLGALALIALGYRSLSLSATAHGPVKAMILDLDARKAEAMMKPLLDSPSDGVSIRDKLKEFAEAEGLPL